MKTAIMLGKKRCDGYNILRTGTRGVWEFNEVLGTTVADESINGSILDKFTGYTNNQTGVSSELTPCLQLDGVDPRIEMRIGNTVLSPQSAHSVSSWVKRSANSATSRSAIINHVSVPTIGQPDEYEIFIYDSTLPTPNRLEASYWDTLGVKSTITYDPPSDIWTGSWRHMVYTRDGNQMKLYVDKILVASATGAGVLMNQHTDTIYPHRFGHILNPSTSIKEDYFNGYFDQMAVWDRALDDVDLCYLNNIGIGLDFSKWK